MKLQELIELLKECPADDYLRIDKCPVGIGPTDVGSYRGSYEQLAIRVEMESYGQTVGRFVELLESRIGTMMTGYKGGEYEITPSTKVWISNTGEVSDARVTGVRREAWGCTFIRWENDE